MSREHINFATVLAGLFGACYLAVLPIPHTMALRNIALLGLLMTLAWLYRDKPLWVKRQIPLPILLWIAYLCFFIVFASKGATTLETIASEWGRGLLAMLAGAGLASVSSRNHTRSAFHIGLISAIPILIYVGTFVWHGWATSSLPWGYRGLYPHHADIGYAAGQTVILLSAVLISAQKSRKLAILFVLTTCFLSTLFVNSRGGLLFCLIGCALVFLCAYRATAQQRSHALRIRHVILGVLGVIALTVGYKTDPRWEGMVRYALAGLSGDALKMQCEGKAYIAPRIHAEYGVNEDADALITTLIRDDGARMAAARVGFALALKHPWGTHASREAYQLRLREECPAPAVVLAHSHNGWLDSMLALGWLGAALYLAVLCYFFAQGIRRITPHPRPDSWDVVLVSLSAFWILRGFADSVFRDHMLEMQGFVLAFAALAAQRAKREGETQPSP